MIRRLSILAAWLCLALCLAAQTHTIDGKAQGDVPRSGFARVKYVKNGKTDTYLGNFRNGKPNGIGRLDTHNGKVYFGKWVDGTYTKPKGQKFDPKDKIYGIDLSHHNANVDWDKLAIYCDSHGRVHNGNQAEIKSKRYMLPVSFVYVRSGEGTTHHDSKYAQYFRAAAAHGIPVGSYHYMRFTTSTVDDQVKTFLRRTNNCLNDDLPPVLDIEDGASYDARKAEQRQRGSVQRMVEQWLQQVEAATGRKPVIYASDHFIKTYLNLKRLKGYKLWIANYNRVKEPEHHPWFMWQFTDKGNISGVSSVDLNYWDGNAAHFRRHMLRK